MTQDFAHATSPIEAVDVPKSYGVTKALGGTTWACGRVRSTLARNGTARRMFASNFPVDKLFSSYDAIFDAFKSIVSDYSDSETVALFHDNSARIYRL